MHFTLISPRLALQKGDFLGSGVPYWPLELATLAAYLREMGDEVCVVDLFGLNPAFLTDAGDHYLQGLPLEPELDKEIFRRSDIFILFAISYMSHGDLFENIRILKNKFPTKQIVVLENAQAVTAYSLQQVSYAIFEAGATALICGEPYATWQETRNFLANGYPGAVPVNLLTPSSTLPPVRSLFKGRHPVPAWDLFNLTAYWKLPYSHGPKTPKFFPVLSSRGCPYPCDFCVVPETSNRQWRGNNPVDVVNEIITLRDQYGVHDFQIEDLNPTIRHQRWEEICNLLIARQAGIRFAFVSGTKAETLQLDKIPLFARAGCRYLSISPESGSPRLAKIIGKKFNYQHAIDLVKVCRDNGIRTQACFIVGHPDETEEDIKYSCMYLKKLVQNGLDEVAVFITASFAGSKLYKRNSIAISNLNALPSFSPKGRVGYEILIRRRRALVQLFFIEKLKRGLDLWTQGFRAVLGMPQTKMENLPRRIAYIYFLLVRMKIARWLDHRE